VEVHAPLVLFSVLSMMSTTGISASQMCQRAKTRREIEKERSEQS
jgi:hypothetical protein